MFKKLINLALYMLLCACAFSQPNDDNAYAGLRAVFIFHGFAPASPQFPDAAGNTGFVLQRRENPAAPWVAVRPFHSPQNLQELIENYNTALALLPDAKRITFNPMEAWERWEKYKSYDSILTDLSYAPGQIAFNVLVTDSTVQAGKTYQYRIVKNVISAPIDSSFISNAVRYPANLNIPVPKFMQRTTEIDMVMISWYAIGFKTVDNFNVYRAEGNNKFALVKPGIRVVQHQDSTIYTLLDKNVAMGEMYRYYIKPINGFSGGGNIISDTVPATCMNPQQLQTPQDLYTKEDVGRGAIVVHYSLPNPGYIGSVHVFRSEHFDSGFAEIGIVGANDTSYVDLKAKGGLKYYYYLQMTDKMGRNSPRSIKTFGLYQDTSNTQIPRYATARAGKDGIEITWENPPSKEEISGYYVYRSAGGGSDFQRLTTMLPVADSINSYVDTFKLLAPGSLYSYCVKSENLSNRLSRNSNVARITTAAPATTATLFTPRNLKAMLDSTNARLIWYDMRSVNNNLAYYRISRKTGDAADYTVIAAQLPAVYTSWVDTTVQAGQAYEYAIESIDHDGHMSAQANSNIIRLREDVLPAPQISLLKTADGGISISWSDVIDARITGYNVYRYIRGDKPEKVAHVNLNESTYTDTKLTADKMYYYYVEAEAGSRVVKIKQSNRVYAMLESK